MVRGHRRARYAALSLGTAAILCANRATAEDADSIEPYAGTSEGTASTTTPSTTRIELDDAWAGDDDLAERLERAPSTNVRRSGSRGQSAWVSIRGAAATHTRVLLDGLPLHGASDTSFDLATLPTDLLDHIDVYRSYVPADLRGSAVGGVIDLRTADIVQPGIEASVGGGSLDARSAHVAANTTVGAHELLLAASMDGATGDFVYRDDNGTPLETRDDDDRVRRANNDHNAISALARHRVRADGWRIDTLAVGGFRNSGSPGTIAVAAEEARQTTWRLHLAGSARRQRLLDDHLDLELTAFGSVRGLELRDPAAELFTGLDRNYADRVSLGGTSVGALWWPAHAISLHSVLDMSTEHYAPRDGDGARVPATRTTLASTFELEARSSFGLEGAAQLRLEGIVEHDDERNDAAVALPTLRIAFGEDVGAHGQIVASASADLAVRHPGFAELYGAGELVVGDPELRSERRRGAELGFDGRFEADEVFWNAQVAGWVRDVDDLIVYYDNGSGVARPRNLERGELRGLDLATSLSWRDALGISGAISLMDARDGISGARLPWRSPWDVDVALTGGHRAVRLEWISRFSAPYTIDREGWSQRPARMTHDLRAAWTPCFEPRLRLAVQLDNLLNLREGPVEIVDGGHTVTVNKPVYDVIGYPLAGRTFFVSLSFNSRSFE